MVAPSTNKTAAAVHGFDDESMNASLVGDDMFHFDRKHVFSLKNNPMCGINFPQWLDLLRENGSFIDACYIPRAIFLTLISLFNSLLGHVESWMYPDAHIAQVQLPDDPVFIVGHPRTGTTLLHNLLASDAANYYACTTFCTGFPSCFLWFEELGKWLFAGTIDKTRPMDSMPLTFDLPQEDECATVLLSRGASYYMPIYFMARETKYRRFLSFSPDDGGTPADQARWTQAFLYLLRKLTLRAQMRGLGSKFVLKSPIHAARIPLLRTLFPKAKFIYMHREPYSMLASSAHLANTAYWFMYLTTPTDEQINEFIFWQFENMWTKYNAAAQAQASPRRVHPDILEVSYHELVTQPEATLAKVYAHANVAWTAATRAHFADEIAALKTYEVNKHATLAPALRARIRRHAQAYMESLNYSDN
ncbi:Aste57867_17934 [Aphanomyces stellatus]|uniref:Aste57867_17934 protein n=1 Tax=Aphanomyces stellatus TaxID=120398 RepID=A0A485L941_9STRA|nr:hypothetical protein As57867_017872 [Aphanomyces stellatus]VFT94675.1 Aste57867_17934 [Aphanomyces stellatus]